MLSVNVFLATNFERGAKHFPKHGTQIGRQQGIPVVPWPEQHERNWPHGTYHRQYHEAEEFEIIPGGRGEGYDEKCHEGKAQQFAVGGGHTKILISSPGDPGHSVLILSPRLSSTH